MSSKKPPGHECAPPEDLTLLSVSPLGDDHARLATILRQSNFSAKLGSAATVQAAMDVMRRYRVPVVIAERDLPPGTWRDLLAGIETLAAQPFLIVSSLDADESLWAEALNLGAFDVLAKPYAAQEVSRVVSWAWLRWCEAHLAGQPVAERRKHTGKAASAA